MMRVLNKPLNIPFQHLEALKFYLIMQYGLVGAFESTTNEQIKKQFDTNVFGVMNVTKAIFHISGLRKMVPSIPLQWAD